MSRDVRMKVYQEPWSDGISFGFFVDSGKALAFAEPLVFTDHAPGSVPAECGRLSNDQTQSLFNQLWKLGYRPKDGTGNSGHIEAIKYHLEDMRKIAFQGKQNDK
jgi:hypothetical protein